MAYCYILYSEKLTKFYIGACNDLSRPCSEHNSGHSKFTKTGVTVFKWFQHHLLTFSSLFCSFSKKNQFLLLFLHFIHS
ncbi:MAG: GIY-YIG nuclease family protein [Saprospiraceae bacterium]|nr:GIY-YIG nuclease family protein [Saprospiraceae bacterium]